MQHHAQKGFTIVELMVTVTIIALLTAIITANISSSKAKSRDAKRISDVAQMQLALELFFDRCNRYPVVETVTDRGVSINVPKLSDTGNGCPSGISLSTFTSAIPLAPTAGDYRYNPNDPVSNASPVDYVIQAKLETNSQALLDDVDTVPTIGSVWVTNSTTGLVCTDSNPYYYCVQPR